MKGWYCFSENNLDGYTVAEFTKEEVGNLCTGSLHGPFPTFGEAKRRAIECLLDDVSMIRSNIKELRKLTKKKCMLDNQG